MRKRADAMDPMKYTPKNSSKEWVYKRSEVLSNNYNPCLPKLDKCNSLAELLDIGLKNNPNTKKSWATARQAAAAYGQSLAAYYPDAEFEGIYQRQKETLEEGNLFIEFYQSKITPDLKITYTLFDFGKRAASSESAKQALYYADLSHNQEIQDTIQTIMQDYFDFLYQKDLVISDEADLKNAQAALDSANQKLKYGTGALGDVAQAKTQYLQTKIALITQKQTVENSFAKLAKDVGTSANIPFKTDDFPKKTKIESVIESVEELICIAQKSRQDFLAAQANLKSKRQDLKEAKAQYYPDIGYSFDVGKDWYGTHGSKEDYHFTSKFTLTLPIFKGFYYKNGIKKAEFAVKEAEAEVLDSELSLIQEVTTSHFNVKIAAETLDYANQYLDAAKLTFDITLGNYKIGSDTILNVLASQSSLADARSKLSDAKKNWYLSLVNLSYATGMLDKNISFNPSKNRKKP